MIRLSICIATLNRGAYIGETLRGILEQMTPEVELIVVDGASTDGTDAIVTGLFNGKDNCRCVRLEQKGGVDRDYARAAAEGRGDFLWLMTDDDLFHPDAVAQVLAQLRDEPDLLVVNAIVKGPDLRETLLNQKLAVADDQVFAPHEQSDLLALAGNLLSFIGAVVIRRTLWNSRKHEPYFGTEFIHVGVIFQAPLERNARVMAEPLLTIRYGNAQWSARAFHIWMFKWPNLVWSFPHLEEWAKAAVTPRQPWRSMRHLVMMKARGCFTMNEYHAYLAPLQMSALTRIWVRMVAAFPDRLLNRMLVWLIPLVVPHAKGTQLELRQSRFYHGAR